MTYLLDTNICIGLLKGQEARLVERLEAHGPLEMGLSAVVKAELLFGARKSRNVERNLLLLRKFFRQFEAVAFDDVAAEHYGAIRSILERQGTPIGANDLLIASTALAHDLVLVTRHDGEPKTPDEALLSDIDLAILGAGPKRFDEYETQVRAEYRHVPTALYRPGRRKVLNGFLERPRIYHTEWFRERYEAQARRNLERSLARLAAKFF